jgi:hypothetical protein
MIRQATTVPEIRPGPGRRVLFQNRNLHPSETPSVDHMRAAYIVAYGKAYNKGEGETMKTRVRAWLDERSVVSAKMLPPEQRRSFIEFVDAL